MPFRQDGPCDDHAEPSAEADGRRKTPDEFSAVFAALACLEGAASASRDLRSDGGEGIAASADSVADAATEGARSDAAPPAFAVPSDAETKVEVARLTPMPGSGVSRSDTAGIETAAAPAPTANAAGRPESPAADASAGRLATGDRPAAMTSGADSAFQLHVLVRPSTVGATATDRAASVDDAAGTIAAREGSLADRPDGIKSAVPPVDYGDRREDAPLEGDERGTDPPKGAAAQPSPTTDVAETAPAPPPQPHVRPTDGSGPAAPPDRVYQPAHHAAELVRQSLPHAAEAARQIGHGTVEIALSPEELGRVRLTIHSDDGATATVRLSADRHETLDLMRRHVDLLAQDLRDLGYRELSFSFQDQPQRGLVDFNRRGEESGVPLDQFPSSEAGAGLAPGSMRHADGSLDLRL